MVGQRVFGLVLGYEDLNDHNDLRLDPVLGVVRLSTGPRVMCRWRARARSTD
jgi:hypothetical protein